MIICDIFIILNYFFLKCSQSSTYIQVHTFQMEFELIFCVCRKWNTQKNLKSVIDFLVLNYTDMQVSKHK